MGCADGWHYRHFYANMNDVEYVGCDIDEEAIIRAKKNSNHTNGRFLVENFEENMPCEDVDFTNVLWFNSMCMFEKNRRKVILKNIAKRLKAVGGVLSGSAMLRNENIYQWEHYVDLIDDVESLYSELHSFFENVYICNFSDKNNLFFMASDGRLPLNSEK